MTEGDGRIGGTVEPSMMWSSEPQMPQASIAMRICPLPGIRTGWSTTRGTHTVLGQHDDPGSGSSCRCAARCQLGQQLVGVLSQQGSKSARGAGVPWKSAGLATIATVVSPLGTSMIEPLAWVCGSEMTSSTVLTGDQKKSRSVSNNAPHSARVRVTKISSRRAMISTAFSPRRQESRSAARWPTRDGQPGAVASASAGRPRHPSTRTSCRRRRCSYSKPGWPRSCAGCGSARGRASDAC